MSTPQYDREEMERHDAEAARRLPGPDYCAMLKTLHATLRSRVYLEIGVLHGASLALASGAELAVGVDPEAAITCALPPQACVVQRSSDEFFATEPGFGPIDFALIDGMHRFEQVLADFKNVEAIAVPGAVIALHDTMPLDERTASRQRETEFYTGDVWKMLVWLQHCRPDLDYITVPAAPTGLTLVRGVSSGGETDTGWIRELPWSYWEAHCSELLHEVSNTAEAVIAWLTRANRQPSSQSTPVLL